MVQGWLDGVPAIPSPSRYEGRRGYRADLLVLHYTASSGSAERVAKMFANPSRAASAHFVVGRDGDVVQCVSLEDGAWSAGDKGKSRFPRGDLFELGDHVRLASVPRTPRQVNCRAVAIALCNRGWDVDSLPEARVMSARHRNPRSHSTRWEVYTFDQLAALEVLVERIVAAVPSLRFVCGHEDLTHYDVTGAGSKLDPGPAFPWVVVDKRFGLRRVLYEFGSQEWRV